MQQQENFQDGLFGKTSSERSIAEEVTTLRQSSGKWLSWGRITLNGASSTLNSSEYPKIDDGYSLWPDFHLQDVNTVPQKYFLSQKAADGIIRRAQKGRSHVPPVIIEVLQAIATNSIFRIEDIHPFIVDGTRVWDVRVYSDGLFPTLKARMGTGGNNVPLVTQVNNANIATIRKLTPSEVEQLMGWPSEHTRLRPDGKVISDTQRYKMCGNGVVSPVAAWVARQIDRSENDDKNI